MDTESMFAFLNLPISVGSVALPIPSQIDAKMMAFRSSDALFLIASIIELSLRVVSWMLYQKCVSTFASSNPQMRNGLNPFGIHWWMSSLG